MKVLEKILKSIPQALIENYCAVIQTDKNFYEK